MTQRLLLALVGGQLVSPVDYGAECDVDCVTDAAVDGGSLSTVTSASAPFSAGDTGKTFTLMTTTGDLVTGTLTFVNTTTATMSSAAGGAVTAGRLIWGTDDTTAWQDALDAALPGQTVGIAEPGYRTLHGPLEIPVAVKLGLFGLGPFDPNTNPAANTWGPTHVLLEHATDQGFTLNRGSGIGDLIIYSAKQVQPTADTATAYAPIIGMASGSTAGCHIGAPYLPNAYDAIFIRGGRHHVERPQVGSLHRAIKIDFSQDVVDIDRVTCHPYWRICEGQAYTPTADSLDEYAQDNCFGVEINRSDAFKIGSIFTFGMYGALLSIDSLSEQGVECGYGMVLQVESDNCVVGIQANETNTPGILIAQATLGSNGTGVGTAGSAGIATITGGSLAPKVVLKSWTHRGSWSTGASSTGAGTTLIVPATNPG